MAAELTETENIAEEKRKAFTETENIVEEKRKAFTETERIGKEKRKVLTKVERIGKEKRKLLAIYRGLDPNRFKTVTKLIERAAFMAATLEDLEEIINEKGYSEEYTNGENQTGQKKTPEVDTYLTMSKTYAGIIKQLTEITPTAPKKKSKLEMLMEDD